MRCERTKKDARKLTESLFGIEERKRPYAPEELLQGLSVALEDVVVERKLQNLESPSQTRLRHRITAGVEQRTHEHEAAKQGVRKEWLPENFPEGEALNGLAKLYATTKKEEEEFRCRQAEATKKQDEDYYATRARDGWRRDQKLIDSSRAREKAERDEARARRGYP